jgi:hypothetical protein
MSKAARPRFLAPLACALGCVLACSASPDAGGAATASGSGGAAMGAGSARGGASGSGGSAAGTMATGGSGGGAAGAMPGGTSGSMSGGTSGNGGSSGSGGSESGGDTGAAIDGSVDGPAATGGFTCTLFVGPSPMMQWFRGGFLQYPGIDAKKFQLIWVAHHYTDAWGAPGDSAWNTAIDKGRGCAQNATAPDRVAFMATQWSHTTAAQWEKDFSGIVANIMAKWPGVKRIELMASTSAPGNKPCPAAGGKNNETIIPAIGYEALDAMPAKFPGLVVALPHFEVPSCSDFIGNGTAPQYAPSATATTGPAVMEVAGVFGAYYATHP